MNHEVLTNINTIPKDTALRVYTIFANTTWGKELETRARYGGMFPDGWSVERWEKLLGPDANNLHHMHQSIINAAQFVADENRTAIEKGLTPIFTFEDAIVLCTAGAIHDQAEIDLGDIAYGLKELDMRSVEEQLLAKHETDFAPHLTPETCQSNAMNQATTAKRIKLYRRARAVAFGDTDKFLPAAFEAIEKLGFLRNCVRALDLHDQLSQTLPPDHPLRHKLDLRNEPDYQTAITALRRVSLEILGSNVFEGLIKLAARFGSLHASLQQHARIISTSMNSVTDKDFEWYRDDKRVAEKDRRNEPQRRKNKLIDQRDKWRHYCETI